ncbi:MAG: zinc ribbon domain-containing protein [Bacteroidota bacterium]
MCCSNCGKEISDDSKFCSSCGSKTINFENTNVSSSPSINIDIPQTPNINDTKEDETLLSSEKKEKVENDPIFQTMLEDKIKPYQSKQRRKWGWGWVILVIMFTQSYGLRGGLSKLLRMRYDNIYTGGFELLGFIVMLIVYFWMRNYLYRYYDDYKPSLISGIISIFSSVFLVEVLCILFSRV